MLNIAKEILKLNESDILLMIQNIKGYRESNINVNYELGILRNLWAQRRYMQNAFEFDIGPKNIIQECQNCGLFKKYVSKQTPF